MHRLINRFSLLLFVVLLITNHSFAQGIKFEEGNWASVKSKAVAAHKMIYLDIFTSWCGPCKMMARNYFPKEEAGLFYNSNFICYQIDAEKGEGLAIAKQYEVNGYPTNLFIDAATEKVIYRTMGMPENFEGFINNGKIAVSESQDPMTVANYEAELKTGKYDATFIKNYLEKNKRLDLDNDQLIDIYLEKYSKNENKDSLILLVSKYQSGVENNGFKYLTANQKRLNELKKNDSYFKSLSQEYYFQSFEKTIKEKNERQFDALLKRVNEFNIDDPKNSVYFYQSQFYKSIKNKKKLQEIEDQYADYLSKMTNEERAAIAKKGLNDIKVQIRWQAEQIGVDKSKIEDVVAKNLEMPQIKYMKETIYSQELNDISWGIYEQNQKTIIDKARVQKALVWAKKAMELIEPIEKNWMPIADTYAHLLEISGEKEKAKKMEEEVVAKATASKDEGLADYQTYLNQLK